MDHVRSCPVRKAAILSEEAENARGALRISLLGAAADFSADGCRCPRA